MRTRLAAVLPVLVTAGLLAACGDDDDSSGSGASGASSSTASSSGTSSSGTSSSAAPATPTGAGATSTPPTDGDDGDDGDDAPSFPADTDPDTAAPSADASLTVTGIRTGGHDGYDRVVFDVAGTGTPGWDVRYVTEASSQGSGAPIAVEGDAILQVTLSGIGYPTETGVDEYDGSAPLPGPGTGTVSQVVWDTTFEGTSVAFVGVAGQTPFRVQLLEQPTRVVLDVVRPG